MPMTRGATSKVILANLQPRELNRLIWPRTSATELRKDGLNATALLVQGPTAEMILREADRLHADVILMGTRAHGSLRELFVGSTSKGVLRQSTRPVLLIPPHDTP